MIDASEEGHNKHKEILNSFFNKYSFSDKEKKEEKEKLEKYLKMLDDAIDELKGAKKFPGFRERDRLVGLSHLALWDEARQESDLRFDLDPEKLLDEAKWFRLYIGKKDASEQSDQVKND